MSSRYSWLAEEAADDLGGGAVLVHGGHEVGEAVAEVLHFSVQGLDVAACLLEHLRRRSLAAAATAAAAAASSREQGLELGDELVDLLLRHGAARPPARHRRRTPELEEMQLPTQRWSSMERMCV